MTGGTPCDLADGQPRQTSVYYICDENAKDEVLFRNCSSNKFSTTIGNIDDNITKLIYEFLVYLQIIILKEVVTCQYEVVVATYLLCKNSKYRFTRLHNKA